MDEEQTAPKVFISYSHDDSDHKKWVISLAEKLLANGVDVLIDVYELRAGDDVPKFMERAVRDSDRVLMICTDRYVAKANDGEGGVGYEAMIVTGELVANLGTSKFVPIIRQQSKPNKVPTSVGTRMYIDFSEGVDADAQLGQLLAELHGARPSKPALGVYRGRAAIPVPANSQLPAAVDSSFIDPETAYQRALNAAETDNLMEWRRIIRESRAEMSPRLKEWWGKYAASAPPTAELVEQSMEGAGAFAPLIAIALAGVASGNPKYQHQVSLIEDVLNPSEWQRSGFTVRAELPLTGAFLYQALHGAMCLHAGNLSAAMRLAQTDLPSPYQADALPLWRQHGMTVWPVALGREGVVAWKILDSLSQRWQWVADVFGDTNDYKAALYAYYVALNGLEYAERLKLGRSPLLPLPGDFRPDVPPLFEGGTDEIKRRGYRLLTATAPDLRGIWKTIGVSERILSEQWGAWINLQRAILPHFYPYASDQLGFQRLVPEVLNE
jgi:hypothetical protein